MAIVRRALKITVIDLHYIEKALEFELDVVISDQDPHFMCLCPLAISSCEDIFIGILFILVKFRLVRYSAL